VSQHATTYRLLSILAAVIGVVMLVMAIAIQAAAGALFLLAAIVFLGGLYVSAAAFRRQIT